MNPKQKSNFHAGVLLACSFSALIIIAFPLRPLEEFRGGLSPTKPNNKSSDFQRYDGRLAIAKEYQKLQPRFEINVGQRDPRVQFFAHMSGYTTSLFRDGFVLSERRGGSAGANKEGGANYHGDWETSASTFRVRLKSPNRVAEGLGEEELPGKTNYFLGNDPSRWHRGVSNFAKVRYQNVYAGIDLIFHGSEGQLEYDFVIEPGANPKLIRLNYEGVSRLEVDSHGDLIVSTRGREFRQSKPVVFQESAAAKVFVDGSYVLSGKNEVSFSLASYDRSKPLIIDPAISYSTYIGAQLMDEAFAVAVDGSGNAYITGETQSTDFPVGGALQPTSAGGRDIFVAKLSPGGSSLIYATYIGGKKDDAGYGIGVDQNGSAYIAGATSSQPSSPSLDGFPVLPAGSTCKGGVFLTRLNSAGNALIYSKCFTGQGARGLAIEEPGIAYLTGAADDSFPGGTNGPKLPAATKTFKAAVDSEEVGNFDAFVLKINTEATGDSSLLYATLLGGKGSDQGLAIATDKAGGACVTGYTESNDFPVSPNAFQPMLIGGRDAFITKLDTTVTGNASLVYSTYLGRENVGLGIAIDTARNIYVTGRTGKDFPTTQSGFQTQFSGINDDAFLSKINPAASSGASSLVYSTYLGGQGFDAGQGIAVDALGNATITGVTQSSDFPTTRNAFQVTHGGHAYQPNFPPAFKSDAFLSRLNPTSFGAASLIYSTFLGGSEDDEGNAVAVDSAGNILAVGTTFSSDFPATPGALRPTINTSNTPGRKSDAFASKFVMAAGSPADVVVSMTGSPSQISAGGQITLAITVLNNGPNQAADLFLRALIPDNTTFQQINAPAAWTCLSPSPGTRGSIICKTPSLAVGAAANFTLVTSVNCSNRATAIRNLISVYAASPDPNETNNLVLNSITANPGLGALTCPASIQQQADTVVSGQSGKIVTYTISSGSCQGVRTTCFPSSGSFFPIGTKRVVCSASDTSGTLGTCLFEVRIDP